MRETPIGFCVDFEGDGPNQFAINNPFHSRKLTQIFEEWAEDNIKEQMAYEVFETSVIFDNKDDALMAYLAFK